MRLFVVTSENGMALVAAENELLAKCDVLDAEYIDDPVSLQATEVDLDNLPNEIMVLLSFQNGSRQV